MLSVSKQLALKLKNSQLKKLLSLDGLVLLCLPILSVFVCINFQVSFFWSIFLFLGLPSVYISFRAPQYILKTTIFSVIASLPLMIILEYVGGFSSAWAFPPSVFPFHILGRVNIEVLLWAFFNIYSVVIFYEFIFDGHQKVALWNKRMWTLVRYLIVWTVMFIVFYFLTNGQVVIPYFYLLFGVVVFIFPLFFTWLYYPKLLPKIFYVLLYFSYLSFIYEITALYFGWWYFPGDMFVGRIAIWGVNFPIEEFIFWIILFAPAVASAFEYLDDDHR